MRDDVRRTIEQGYDAMADRFAAWQKQITGSTRTERIERLLELLPPDPHVLELGIGAGVHSSRLLAACGRLTGVDLSTQQLRRARERLPDATLIQADFTELELHRESFDAVVAAYVLNHLPPEELGKVPQVPGSLDAALDALESDNDFLRAGGVFTDDLIETWLEYKRLHEIDEVRLRPHPWEFMLYYDI